MRANIFGINNEWIIFLILILSLNKPGTAQSGWIQQTSGTTNWLFSVYFSDVNVGYTVGDSGIVLKTTNGGENWDFQSSGSAETFRSVHFLDADTGWIVGNNGTILKTTDGGLNWSSQASGINNSLRSVHFVNDHTGYAVGSMGVILKTTDSGMNWNSQVIDTNYHFNSVHFINASIGYIAGFETYGPEPTGIILKTTNGGMNWSFKLVGSPLNSIYFSTTDTGYAVGGNLASQDGHIYKTTNGGANWNFQVFHYTPNLYSVYFASADTGYVAGSSLDRAIILKTADSGANWSYQSLPVLNYPIRSIFFANVDTGYAVGNLGTILKTTTGGVTGIKEGANENPKEFYLSQNYPNPFNPQTNFGFWISDFGFVEVKIYDVVGKEVKTLLEDRLAPGSYEVQWDGRDNNGETVASGIYIYRLKVSSLAAGTGAIILSKKMTLIR